LQFYNLFLSIEYVYYNQIKRRWFGWIKVFNATFNNISIISWRLVLLVEETGLPGENQQILSHNVSSEWDSNSQLSHKTKKNILTSSFFEVDMRHKKYCLRSEF